MKKALRFRKHYTLGEARALLPQIRQWLATACDIRAQLQALDDRFRQLLAAGADLGGESVHRQIKLLAEMECVLHEFARREIQIKDLDRGLLDFPALIGGKEVFLCWEQDEEDIEFWHDLDAGFAGRERLP
jgi:hypothetical protein